MGEGILRIEGNHIVSEIKETGEIIPTRISETDKYLTRAELKEGMIILNQAKESTALKQLARIGLNVLHDPKTKLVIQTITENKQRNKKRGIIEFD